MMHSLPTGREMRIGSVDRAHEIRTCSRFSSHERTRAWQHACTRAFTRGSRRIYFRHGRALPNASPTRSRWTAAVTLEATHHCLYTVVYSSGQR